MANLVISETVGVTENLCVCHVICYRKVFTTQVGQTSGFARNEQKLKKRNFDRANSFTPKTVSPTKNLDGTKLFVK